MLMKYGYCQRFPNRVQFAASSVSLAEYAEGAEEKQPATSCQLRVLAASKPEAHA
jgi:hypothetical protein